MNNTNGKAAPVNIKKLHIGKMIRDRIEEVGMTKSEFARRIDTSPQNVFGIFKRKSCDTELLLEISTVLNYDFFVYYLPASTAIGDNVLTPAQLKREYDLLQKEVEQLRRDKEYLTEIYTLNKKELKTKK